MTLNERIEKLEEEIGLKEQDISVLEEEIDSLEREIEMLFDSRCDYCEGEGVKRFRDGAIDSCPRCKGTGVSNEI